METEITFEPSKRSGLLPQGTYLLDAANRLGIVIDQDCGRAGNCDSCAVKVISGMDLLCSPTESEVEHLSGQRRMKGERLACQARIEKTGEIVVMASESKKSSVDNSVDNSEKEKSDYHKEFAELPLEKKVARLLEMEMITLSETFSFVLNTPFKVAEKVMDVMAEFGMKMEKEEAEAKKPTEHKSEDGAKADAPVKGKTARKAAGTRKPTAKKAARKKAPVKTETDNKAEQA
jgi:ferredoxin